MVPGGGDLTVRPHGYAAQGRGEPVARVAPNGGASPVEHPPA
jgi:hypothetical protein